MTPDSTTAFGDREVVVKKSAEARRLKSEVAGQLRDTWSHLSRVQVVHLGLGSQAAPS